MLLSACDTVSNPTSALTSTPVSAPALSNIAEVESVSVSLVTGGLDAVLKPINAKANTNYEVDLYEKGNLRQSENITWNEPQINVGTTQMIFFGLSTQEYNAYLTASENNSNWWEPIFSIKVREILPITTIPNQSIPGQRTITLTYPRGGEIWHVGEVVTIKWTSTNLPKDTPVIISIWPSDVTPKIMSITGDSTVPNTGSYQWTVPNSAGGYSIIGTHEIIGITCSDAQLYSSSSSNDSATATLTITK